MTTRNEAITNLTLTLPDKYEVISKQRWTPENGLEEDRLSLWFNASTKVRMGTIVSIEPPVLSPDIGARYTLVKELAEDGWEILDRPLQDRD